MIIEHVLDKQADTKALKNLLQRDPTCEESHGSNKRYPGGKLAKSSWVGRDPFGDEATPEASEDGKVRAQQLLLIDIQDSWLSPVCARAHTCAARS